MAPRKRARAAAASAAASTPKLTLSGGEPHHSELASLWRDARFTDIVVCAEGVECRAHRIVLASSSGYFRRRFESTMRDAADHTHSLEGMRAPVLRALLTFVYEGSCEIEESQLTEMLDASARLMVEPLKAACAAMMASQLSPDNALEVWRIAESFSLPSLEKAAVASALGGFEELPPQLASGAQVLALVQEELLVAKNEEAVFVWIARWWEAGKRPEAELMAVLKHVRFATMAEGFVRDTVRAWPALLSAGGQGVVDTSLAPVVGGVLPSPRLGVRPHRIYLAGGAGAKGAVCTVLAYDPALDSWCQVASMARARCVHGAVGLDGKLYVMGGYDPGDPGEEGTSLADAEVFDPKADGWQPLPSMPTARHCFAAAEVAGTLYALGGLDGSYEHCASDSYDPLSDAWTPVAAPPQDDFRFGPATAAVGAKIYVFGGMIFDAEGSEVATDRASLYDPANNCWQALADMPTARGSATAAVMGGKIYVSGGKTSFDPTYFSDAFEAYDPATNTWATLAGLSGGRADHASVAFHGTLYMFGGSFSWGKLALVEVYNPAENTWRRTSHEMPRKMCSVQAVAL